MVRPLTPYELYNQGYGNLNYSILSDTEVQYVVEGVAARVTYHSSYANAEWWADVPFKILGFFAPDTKIAGAAKILGQTDFIYQGITDLAADSSNLHPDFTQAQHVQAVLDNRSYNEFAQGRLDGREYLYPLAPGAPLGFPLINYNGDPTDDYFGLVGSDVETVQISECFPANTKIQLSDGTSKPIAEIAVLDEVAAFHPVQFAGRGGLASQPVVRLFENITDVWIRLSNGLTVTPGHHFLDTKGNFRTIETILASDGEIISANGEVIKISGEYVHYSAQTADMFEQAEGLVMPHAGGLVGQSGSFSVTLSLSKGLRCFYRLIMTEPANDNENKFIYLEAS